MVSAWASSNRVVLGQTKVDDRSNEITAIPELLRVSGCGRVHSEHRRNGMSKGDSSDDH